MTQFHCSKRNVLQFIMDRPVVLKHLDKIQVRVTRSHMRSTKVARLIMVLRDAEILRQSLHWLWFVEVAMVFIVIEFFLKMV
jgi:hypothetical protein